MNKQELHKQLICIAALSTSHKKKVGAILAKDVVTDGNVEYFIHAEGWNHDVACMAGPCEDVNGKTKETVIHAEQHCINVFRARTFIQAAKHLTMYVTHEPCISCQAALLEHNIKWVRVKHTEEQMAEDKLSETLKERGSAYGTFAGNSKCTQNIMRILCDTAREAGRTLQDYELEAFHMIAHKMSRVANGKKVKKDNWHDIAGYAKLAEDLTVE